MTPHAKPCGGCRDTAGEGTARAQGQSATEGDDSALKHEQGKSAPAVSEDMTPDSMMAGDVAVSSGQMAKRRVAQGDGEEASPSITPPQGETPAGLTRHLLPWLPVVAALLLAANALRRDAWGLLGLWCVVACLACTRQAWARIVVSLALCAGVVVWADTTQQFVSFRMMAGLPWGRLVAIMATVGGITALSSLVLLGRAGEARYTSGRDMAGAQAWAALLTFAGLMWIRHATGPLTPLLAERLWPGSGMAQAALMAVYAAWAVGRLADPKLSRVWRPRLWALFSFVFFMQLALGLIGYDIFLMTGRLHLPVPALILAGPLYRGTGWFMLGLFTFSTLLLGSAWCSHLCYIGAWDDMASRRKRRCGTLPNHAGRVRLGIALLVFGGAVALRLLGVGPVAAFTAAACFGLAGVGVMLAVSTRRGVLVHCTTYCPMGLLADVMGRLTPWRLQVDTGRCTRCGACSAVCRYDALTPADIEGGAAGFTCSRCRDCLAVCRHGAMRLTFAGRGIVGRLAGGVRAETIFVVTAVTLHAIFLAVARM
ncbi:4Fe-4S binding protein [Nitratidesulfovibrio vulgaris]|uniref:4Fe-4S binding protein n=1 Tax=Nitratidesulfovibrio vulgaris TaxID=881 RepID=UPI0013E07833|nr:4Fe-4S binding protein [Nitratidesulfovibrio vulgaris]